MARRRRYSRRRSVQARPRCPATGQFLPFYDTPGDGLNRYGKAKRATAPRRRRKVAASTTRRRRAAIKPLRRKAAIYRARRRAGAPVAAPWWGKPANRRNKGSSSASLKNLRASFRKKHGDNWYDKKSVKAQYDKRKAKLKK